MPETRVQAADSAFSEQEIADAKAAMCEAWDVTYASIKNVASKTTPDPNLNYVLILETQVVFHVSDNYLYRELEKHPATPPGLANALDRLIESYAKIVLARLGDRPEPAVEPIKQEMDAAGDFIQQECA